MTEAPRETTAYGRSYWDIVAGKFRRNRVAVAAVWLIGILIVVAIYAPLVANDRPYAFYGTIPYLYERAYKEWVGPAHMTLQTAPERYTKDKTVLADEEQATLALLLEFLDEGGRRSFREEFLSEDAAARGRNALACRIHKNHPLRGALLSGQVTLAELRPELNPEEAGKVEAALAKSRGRVREIYQERVDQYRDGILSSARQLADHLPEEQGLLELRISKLEDLLSRAQVIDLSNYPRDQVHILSNITVKNLTTKKFPLRKFLIIEYGKSLVTGIFIRNLINTSYLITRGILNT